MNIKISQSQTQKQILAPSMQQSIEILMLPIMDLTFAVNQELQTNPLLEACEEPLSGDDTRFQGDLPVNMGNQDNQYSSESFSLEEDLPDEQPMPCDTTLEEELFRQLHFETSDPQELRIGEFILGNLNEDGYLPLSNDDIAAALGLENTLAVEKIRKIIQGLDPIGIGARDLKECLITQANEKFNGDGHLARIIIESFLNELSHKKFALIARQTGKSINAVKKAALDIASLEPRPARNHRPIRMNTFIKPDVFVVHDKDSGYQIHLNRREIPRLRINPLYRDLLKNKNLPDQEREFISERLKNAILFIKSVEQRGQTLRNIAQFILNKQTDFFEHDHMAIRPLALKDVANALNRNESTISRAIHNKYMDTPHGLFPIKFFFSQAIERTDNNPEAVGETSSRGIKEEIKDLIAEEDKKHPLSDQEIQALFEKKGMKIARRTISKYRLALHIPPSHLRK